MLDKETPRASEQDARTAGFEFRADGTRFWRDPGNGEFARVGWSTEKGLLMAAVRGLLALEHVRGKPDGDWLTARDNYLSRVGVRRGEAVKVRHLDDQYGEIEVHGPDGTTRQKVKWERFDDELPGPDTPRVEQPTVTANTTRTTTGAGTGTAARIQAAGGTGEAVVADNYLNRYGAPAGTVLPVRYIDDGSAEVTMPDGTKRKVKWARFTDDAPGAEPGTTPAPPAQTVAALLAARPDGDWDPDTKPADAALAEAANRMFTFDLGGGYRSKLVMSRAEYGTLSVTGEISGPDGERVGDFTRRVQSVPGSNNTALVAVDHGIFHLTHDHQGQGVGTRFMNQSLAAYTEHGVDRVSLLAVSRLGGDPKGGSNGAYTWAKAGFDWETVRDGSRIGELILAADPDNPIGKALVDGELLDDPGHPTPLDVALDPVGKQVLLGETSDVVGWSGIRHLTDRSGINRPPANGDVDTPDAADANQVRGAATQKWYEKLVADNPTLTHTSSLDRVDSILANGLDPDREGQHPDGEGFVAAEGRVYLGQTEDAGWLASMAGLDNKGGFVQIDVDTALLERTRLVPDEDMMTVGDGEVDPAEFGIPLPLPGEGRGEWATRVRLGEQPGVVEAAWDRGKGGAVHTLAHVGPIPPSAIRRVTVHDNSDPDTSKWTERVVYEAPGNPVASSDVELADIGERLRASINPEYDGDAAPLTDTEIEQAAAMLFNHDLGGGYRSEATTVELTPADGNTQGWGNLSGVIYGPDGTAAGGFVRTLSWDSDTGRLSVDHDQITLARDHQRKGVGSRFFASSVDAYREAGFDRVFAYALTDEDSNGAYTWAVAGFDWDFDQPDVADQIEHIGRTILDADPESRLGKRLAAFTIDDVPYKDVVGGFDEWDFPTPMDIAADPIGKQVLLAEIGDFPDIQWLGTYELQETNRPPATSFGRLKADGVTVPVGQFSRELRDVVAMLRPGFEPSMDDDETIMELGGTLFNHELGNGYDSVFQFAAITGDNAIELHADIELDGERVGYAERRLTIGSDGHVSVHNELFMLDADHQRLGVGSRLTAATIDAYRAAGIDRVTTDAVTYPEAVAEYDEAAVPMNGAYTWAKAGFDWASRFNGYGIGERILAIDPDSTLGKALVVRGDGIDGYPTPLDVALDPVGKRVLLGETGEPTGPRRLQWAGVMPLSERAGAPTPSAMPDTPVDAPDPTPEPVAPDIPKPKRTVAEKVLQQSLFDFEVAPEPQPEPPAPPPAIRNVDTLDDLAAAVATIQQVPLPGGGKYSEFANPDTRAAVAAFADRMFTHNLGDGYTSTSGRVVAVTDADGRPSIGVHGEILAEGSDEPAGSWYRMFHVEQTGEWTVEHGSLDLTADHQGLGAGTRFAAMSEDAYRDAGFDAVTVHAVTDDTDGRFGALVWATTGYDWDTTPEAVEAVRALGELILEEDDESWIGEALAGWDGELTAGFPTPLDVAADETGHDVLTFGPTSWYGRKPLQTTGRIDLTPPVVAPERAAAMSYREILADVSPYRPFADTVKARIETDAARWFNHDLEDGYRSEVTGIGYARNLEGDTPVTITGAIVDSGGVTVGEWIRHLTRGGADAPGSTAMVDDDFVVSVKHELIRINPEHQGKGVGSRFYAAAKAEYERAGIDAITTDATSDVGAEIPMNGAYTWALAGYDWDPGALADAAYIGQQMVAADPESVLGQALVNGDLNDPNFPTPLDVAMDPVGKRVLSGEYGPTSWSGVIALSDRVQPARMPITNPGRERAGLPPLREPRFSDKYLDVAERTGATFVEMGAPKGANGEFSTSGLKAHVRSDTITEVADVLDRLAPVIEQYGLGAKGATARFFDLVRTQPNQQGKGVTLYFPTSDDQFAAVEAIVAALDGYQPSVDGLPGSDVPLKGADWVPPYLGFRREFPAGPDVRDFNEYRQRYQASTEDEDPINVTDLGGAPQPEVDPEPIVDGDGQPGVEGAPVPPVGNRPDKVMPSNYYVGATLTTKEDFPDFPGADYTVRDAEGVDWHVYNPGRNTMLQTFRADMPDGLTDDQKSDYRGGAYAISQRGPSTIIARKGTEPGAEPLLGQLRTRVLNGTGTAVVDDFDAVVWSLGTPTATWFSERLDRAIRFGQRDGEVPPETLSEWTRWKNGAYTAAKRAVDRSGTTPTRRAAFDMPFYRLETVADSGGEGPVVHESWSRTPPTPDAVPYVLSPRMMVGAVTGDDNVPDFVWTTRKPNEEPQPFEPPPDEAAADRAALLDAFGGDRGQYLFDNPYNSPDKPLAQRLMAVLTASSSKYAEPNFGETTYGVLPILSVRITPDGVVRTSTKHPPGADANTGTVAFAMDDPMLPAAVDAAVRRRYAPQMSEALGNLRAGGKANLEIGTPPGDYAVLLQEASRDAKRAMTDAGPVTVEYNEVDGSWSPSTGPEAVALTAPEFDAAFVEVAPDGTRKVWLGGEATAARLGLAVDYETVDDTTLPFEQRVAALAEQRTTLRRMLTGANPGAWFNAPVDESVVEAVVNGSETPEQRAHIDRATMLEDFGMRVHRLIAEKFRASAVEKLPLPEEASDEIISDLFDGVLGRNVRNNIAYNASRSPGDDDLVAQLDGEPVGDRKFYVKTVSKLAPGDAGRDTLFSVVIGSPGTGDRDMNLMFEPTERDGEKRIQVHVNGKDIPLTLTTESHFEDVDRIHNTLVRLAGPNGTAATAAEPAAPKAPQMSFAEMTEAYAYPPDVTAETMRMLLDAGLDDMWRGPEFRSTGEVMFFGMEAHLTDVRTGKASGATHASFVFDTYPGAPGSEQYRIAMFDDGRIELYRGTSRKPMRHLRAPMDERFDHTALVDAVKRLAKTAPKKPEKPKVESKTAGGVSGVMDGMVVMTAFHEIMNGLGIDMGVDDTLRVAKSGMSNDLTPLSEAPAAVRTATEIGLLAYPKSWISRLAQDRAIRLRMRKSMGNSRYGGVNYYPTSWQSSKGHVDADTIETIDPSVSLASLSTWGHEFGHSFQRSIPGLRAAERWYVATRLARTTDPKKRKAKKYAGGRSNERSFTYEDDFGDLYASRTYGGGFGEASDLEITTVAVQGLYERFLARGSKSNREGFDSDPELQAWLIGMMAVYDPTGDTAEVVNTGTNVDGDVDPADLAEGEVTSVNGIKIQRVAGGGFIDIATGLPVDAEGKPLEAP